MILASHGLIASQIASFDADAVAFFQRVSDATGTLSLTEKQAVNQLVLDLKANSLWTPMKAIYPMVGASAAACAQNLKSSSFTGTFTSGWTFASTGVTPNGTSAYMDTNLTPSISLGLNSGHLSIYSRTNIEDLSSDLSSESTGSGNQQIILSRFTGLGFVSTYGTYSASSNYANTDSRGLFITNRNSTTNSTAFKNNTKVLDYANTSSLSTKSLLLAADNYPASIVRFSVRQYAFASIGDGLTDTQASNFYTAVQAFQTTLNRQIAP
jgi:hypothetical protein